MITVTRKIVIPPLGNFEAIQANKNRVGLKVWRPSILFLNVLYVSFGYQAFDQGMAGKTFVYIDQTSNASTDQIYVYNGSNITTGTLYFVETIKG